jgi:Gpi18-like mannosyltransferase
VPEVVVPDVDAHGDTNGGTSGGKSDSDDQGAERGRSQRSWAVPLLVYGAVLAVLLVVSWRVTASYTEAVPPSAHFAGSWFWDGWVRYDAGWYSMIAGEGYTYVPGQQSTVAFFPAYPLLMRGLGNVIDNTTLAGVAVTIASGAGAVVAFHRWCRDRLSPSAALTAVVCLMVYPYAYYLYGAVYGDALFLLCALLAFLAFERDQMVLAGVAGAVATGTRLVGLAVVVGLVVGVLERRRVIVRGEGWRPRVDVSRLRPRDAGVLLSVTGLAAFSAYLWSRFDDPLLFSTVQETWGQQSGWRTWFKYDVYLWVRREPDMFYTHGLLIQAALFGLVVLTIPTVARRFGLRYGAYLAALVVIPAVGSQDFQGMGRYLLGAFPAFAVLGSLLADHPRVRRCVLPLSAVVLVVFTGMFANGRYIS